jgi:uncharacterized protein YndB with AHSA1/START domain
MPYSFTLSTAIPATPAEIYDAWLDSIAHAEMTGGGEAVMSDEIGAEISAWAGYITGRNLELVPAERIVQSWRTTEFDDETEDSIVTILLQETEDGTLLTLEHSNVPDLHKSYEEGGWQSNYFEPMIAYFSEFEEDFTEPEQQPQSAQPAESELGAVAEAEPEPAVERHVEGESLHQREVRHQPPSEHNSVHENGYDDEPERERTARPIAPARSATRAPGARSRKARGRERGAGGLSVQGAVPGAAANKRGVAAAEANKKAVRPAPDKKAAKPVTDKKTVRPATNKKAAKPAAKKAAKPPKPSAKKKSSAKKKTAKPSAKKRAANKSAQRSTKRRTAKTAARSGAARSRKAARRKR